MIRIKKLFKCAAAVAAFSVMPALVTAQSAVSLTGKVEDAQGAPIRDAVVMVKHGHNLLASARTLSDAQGNFGTFKDAVIDIDKSGAPLLIVKKAGYLPDTSVIGSLSENVGTITLARDPLERRIDSVMALMNTADKIYQMTQAQANSGTTTNGPYGGTGANSGNLLGSVLRGGDGHAATHLERLPSTLSGWTGNVRIPVVYGKDAVHGNAGVPGYTVFPHNIGLGATRDSALVRKIGEATAKEMWAAGINLNFSPAISVARDPRWGRTYESYGEEPELHVELGAAMVRGLQGARYDAPWRIIATAKHFLGDGGTTNGKDRGNTPASDDELRSVHLPGYEAVVEQGVLSVMASFNTIRGTHQHVDSLRMTGWLKTELGFDGYIISDWQGIANSTNPGFTGCDYGDLSCSNPTLTQNAVRDAVNAGIDLAMEPGTHTTFITHLTALVNSGAVKEERIDDAVRRILRAKFRAGFMDNIGVAGPSEYLYNAANRASPEHRAIAREAVRKSLVLLKNDNAALPLAKNASIHVFGSHRDDIGRQCGGWTIGWQGVTGNSGGGGISGVPNFNFTTYGTSILQGMEQVAQGAAITASASANTSSAADVIVYVTGENPYAEWNGDSTNLNFTPPSADMTALNTFRGQGKKIVTIFISGRPRIVPELLNASDAFVAAWLPGTEGVGVADVLFGDHPFAGRLPITWPGSSGTQFEYGYAWGVPVAVAEAGRTIPALQDNVEEAVVVPSDITINALTAGPNPVERTAGGVRFFWQGGAIKNGTLSIYDASGNFIKKVAVKDGQISGRDSRAVGSWDFTDRKGRTVAVGSYLLKGTVKTAGGKRVRVSVVISVR